MVIANINYLCIVYILFCIGLIIFLKPGLEPRLWAFSCCKPSPSPIQAHQWAGLGWAQTGWAGVGFGLWARPSTSLATIHIPISLAYIMNSPQLLLHSRSLG